MKKKLVIGLLVLSVGMTAMTACGNKAENSGENAAIANPMKEYKDDMEVTEAIGHPVLVLSQSAGYTMAACYIIDNTLAEINYVLEGQNDVKLCVRTSKGTADNSGYYDVEYQEKDMSGALSEGESLIVEKGSTSGGNYVAWWNDGTYSYSVSASGLEEETFDAVLGDLVRMASFIE